MKYLLLICRLLLYFLYFVLLRGLRAALTSQEGIVVQRQRVNENSGTELAETMYSKSQNVMQLDVSD